MHSKDIKMLAPPTATFELTRAAQVSTSLYFIVLSLDMSRFCLSHPTNSTQGGSGYLVYSELCLSYYKCPPPAIYERHQGLDFGLAGFVLGDQIRCGRQFGGGEGQI